MISKRLIFFIFSILLTIQFGLYAQQDQKEYIFINIKDGISKVGMSTIVQDNYGFIWIGTNGEGLYRFDGIDYKSYSYKIDDKNSLNSSLIYCAYFDKFNQLWVGTEEGLNLYDKEKDKFKRFEFNVKDVRENESISVSSLTGDSEGNLYIGTFESGLFMLKKGSSELIKVPINQQGSVSILNVNGLASSKDGAIYAGTSSGLMVLDKASNALKSANFMTSNGAETFSYPIQSIIFDSSNTLWVGTISNGLFKITSGDGMSSNKSKIEQFPITTKRILSMVQIPDKSIMVGTENDGLFNLKTNGDLIKNYVSKKTDKNSIKSNSIWSLFVDRNQRIWMGYYNNGIGVFDVLYDKFNHIESLPSNQNSLQVSSVTGIAKSKDGKFWISMDGGGIDIYDANKKTISHINMSKESLYKGLNTLDIQTIFIDSKNNAWAGSWNNGLFLLENGSTTFKNYNSTNTPQSFNSNSILSFDEDSKGTIWIGTFYNGVMSYNPTSRSFTHHNIQPFLEYQIEDKAVRKILVDSKDNVWVGTTQGLFKIHQNGYGTYNVESMRNKMRVNDISHTSTNHILTLYESSDHHIWIGTRGAGLCRYDVDKDNFKWYNKISGLLENNVSAITQSLNGDIWISGNSGLSRIDLEHSDIVNYTTNDGLLSNDFNFNAVYRESDDGTLYFGNYKGIDYFNPNTIKVNNSFPELYITGLKIFNEEVNPDGKNSPLKKVMSETDSITFNHKQDVFTIEYTGLNYTRPEKNKYAYYLEGLEETWNYVGNARSATYTNLDHGDYTFKVKSSNNDGIWNETPITLKITILPPWWKTNLAIISYFLLFFISLFVLNKITQSRLRDKEILRNERIQRAQEDELHEKKLQFFTNISHEFRTPLTLMINPLQDIINDPELRLPESVKEKHKVIQKNTDRLYRLINELMDLRKLELDKIRIRASKINMVSFVKDVMGYFKEEAFHRNIHFTLDTDLPDIYVWADQGMLEKIIFNILSNAFKVTPEGGTINIDVVSKDDSMILPLVSATEAVKIVELMISDTGPGLKKKQVKRIFERFYQVENLNKTYYGGTGIGLEVVNSFVKLHKGKVEVESVLNEGTSFRIIFPKGKSHFTEKEIVSFKSEMLSQKDHNTFKAPKEEIFTGTTENTIVVPRTNTLLIVEDNLELRNYLKNELKKTYKILVAGNGKEGLKIAKETLPDVIVTDVIMPEMDGFDFCKHIKTDIRTSHIPLLMLTAKSQIDDRIEGIGYGADAYMVKPFDLRLLKLRLSQLITSRKLIFDKYFGAISGAEENANATSIDKEFISKVLEYINKNISDSNLSVELLASQLNLSRSQLYRKIKTLSGQTVNEFIRKIRLEKAKQILMTGNATISEVSYKVGFSSPSYFTKCFKAHFGKLPTDIEVNE